MDNFPNQLKKLRREKGLNQNELAQALGLSKTAVSNYETGYAPPSSTNLRKIAAYFDVSISELLGEKPTAMHETSIAVPTTGGMFVYATLAAGVSPVPLYTLSLPPALIGEGNFFGLRITGDRMDRLGLTEGSIAIVRRQNFADDGDIVAAAVGSDPAFISRLYRTDDYITLVAESNSPSFHPMVINPQSQNFTIFGKVVKVIKSVI